jgi:hypothetical protein
MLLHTYNILIVFTVYISNSMLQFSCFSCPHFVLFVLSLQVGRDSSVSKVTRYWLDGPGIQSGWGRYFFTRMDRPRGPTQPRTRGYHVSPGRGVALTTHTHLFPRLKKKYSYTSTLCQVRRGLLQVELYLNSSL